MPRKTVENDDLGLPTDDMTPNEKDEQEFEQKVLDAFGGTETDVQWIMFVSKIEGTPNKAGSKECKLFTADKSEFDGLFERLRDTYGSGAYRIKVNRNNVLWAQTVWHILAPPTKEVTPSTELSSIMQAVQSNNEKMLQAMERMNDRIIDITREKSGHSDFDPVKLFSAMGTMMLNFQNMIPKPAPVSQEKSKDPAAMMKEVMSLFREGFDFAQNINPENRSAGMTGLVERLLDSPLLTRIVEGIQAPQSPQPLNLPPPRNPAQRPPQGPVRPQSAVPPGQSAPTAEPTVSAPEATPDDFSSESEDGNIGEISPSVSVTPEQFMQMLMQNPTLQQQVKASIDYLLTRAQRDADPGFYADWILDNWPSEFIDFIINTPNLVDQLQYFIPELAQHRAWFNNLIDECLKVVKDEPGQANGAHFDAPSHPTPTLSVDGHPGRESGSGGNAGHDEGIGETGESQPGDPGESH